ncbi:MAG: ParA family protein [Sphingorhabdus sp.]|uniref:ParA family protein n=1 Tax=Sphingorhabdus sp. TaxID=1902408 RepID=UPI0038FC918C
MENNAKVIAVYSLKGGVGKTTLTVNLAAEAALRRGKKALLWDLDPQSAASFILGCNPEKKSKARSVFERDIEPGKLIVPTTVAGLDLLPADISLRGLDGFFNSLGKKKRLAKLVEAISGKYDRIFLDCPPGLTETSEQMMRAADIIIVPVIPSPLSQRALEDVVSHLKEHHKGHAPLLPVFSMVDRRRNLHVAALSANPDWPRIPMASAVEMMAVHRSPVGVLPIGPRRVKLSICFRGPSSVSLPSRRNELVV